MTISKNSSGVLNSEKNRLPSDFNVEVEGVDLEVVKYFR